MPAGDGSDDREAREGTRPAGGQDYSLRLFVTGMTPRSLQAIANIKQVCEAHFRGRYVLEVIDLYQHPERAQQEQVIASPTLVRVLPLPLRRLVGNLADTDRVLLGLKVRHGH